MSSSLDHKCQRCGSQYHGQICPFCTITGLDVNALLASEGLTMPETPASDTAGPPQTADAGTVLLLDIVSNRTYPITMPLCRFGRDISNDIVLTGDKSLSRFHFQLTCNNGEYFVEDSGSRNGSFLNGTPITAPRKLVDGDIISAGMSRYRFAMNAASLAEHMAKDAAEAAAAGEQAAPEGNGSGAPKPTTAEEVIDPLQRIFQEGQALLGKDDESEGPSELDAFFAKHDKPMPAAPAPENKFMQLERADETPVDQLFESQGESLPAQPPPLEAAMPEPAAEPTPPPVLPPADLGISHNGQQPFTATESPVEAPIPLAETREWPAWCTNYTFSEIDEIRSRMNTLSEEIQLKQTELSELENRVSHVENMKNRLLATRNGEFVESCSTAFAMLGLTAELNNATTNELVLSESGKTVAIARIVCTDSQPKPAELANLVSSLSTYWCDHGVEPKGILVVSFITDGPPADRPELAKDYADYASKKNVCLMTSLQLLSIYREVSLRSADVESIKSALLSASGQLSGFELTASSEDNR